MVVVSGGGGGVVKVFAVVELVAVGTGDGLINCRCLYMYVLYEEQVK